MTGLPGVGKTTGITQFLRKPGLHPVGHLDIQMFSGRHRERNFYKAAKAIKDNVILESACGLRRMPSYIIRVIEPMDTIYQRLKIRDGQYDPDYLSLISGEMIAPDCTIYTAQELPELLQQLFTF